MKLLVKFGAGAFFAALALAGGAMTAAAADEPSLAISKAQVDRGEYDYVDNCVMCHGYDLNDGEFGPPIKGSFFRKKWIGKSVGELFTKTVMTMPQSNPDSLDPNVYADIMAYVFAQNGIKPGDKDMPSDAEALNKIPLPW
jgi:mono/diheme cytochrome c family protein